MKKSILLLCLFAISAQVFAQLGLKKLKSKSGKAKVELNYSEHRFAPVMEFQSLLSNLSLNPETGVFTTVGLLNAYFLPSKDKSGNLADYSSKANDPDQTLIRADIVNVSGGDKTVATFHYMAQKVNRVITPIDLISGYGSKNRFVKETELKQAGDYEMRFYLLDEPFYAFAFQVVETKSDDPYSPIGAIYTLGGDWEAQALLQVNSDDNGAKHQLRFQPILAYRGFHIRSGRESLQLNGEAERKVVLKRGANVIGTFHFEESKGEDVFEDKYVPAFDDFNLRVGREDISSGVRAFQKVPKVETAGERNLLMEDLTDGNYTVEMTVKGMSDRPDFTKTYHFTVRNGKVLPSPKANRSKHQNPLTLIESGRDFVVIGSK